MLVKEAHGHFNISRGVVPIFKRDFPNFCKKHNVKVISIDSKTSGFWNWILDQAEITMVLEGERNSLDKVNRGLRDILKY